MPDYENIIGSTSAAALGFIHGNVKGAKLGYEVYQKYRNMVPVNVKLARALGYHRTPKRQKLRSGNYGHPTPQSSGRGRNTSLNPNRKRRLSGTYGRSSSVSSSSRAKSVGSTRRTSGGNNNLNNAQKYRKVGKISTRHRKSVKVPKRLRAQIKTVTVDKGAQGYRSQIWNDFMIMGPAIDTAQRKFKFNNGQNTSQVHVFFTPLQLMNSAAVIFNLKPAVFNYLITAGNFNFPTAGDSNSEKSDLIFEVVSQKATYVFKNNSQRHYAFTITCMTPKENTDNVPALTIDEAILADIASGQWNGSSLVPPRKENLAITWQDSPTLKQYYKMEKTLIKLDPGASSSYVLHGYTGVFNWKKSIKQDQQFATEHWDYPKNDTKFLVFDCIPNLVSLSSTAGGTGNYAGRWLATAGTTGAPILFDIKEEITMNAPSIKQDSRPRNSKHFENYTSAVTAESRVIATRDMDDEGTVNYVPQNS